MVVVSLPFFFFLLLFLSPFLSFFPSFQRKERRNDIKWKRSVHGDSHEFYSVIMYRQKRPLWEWVLRLPFARTLSGSAFQSRDSLESHCHLPKLPSRRWCRLRKRYPAALPNKTAEGRVSLTISIPRNNAWIERCLWWRWPRAKFNNKIPFVPFKSGVWILITRERQILERGLDFCYYIPR